LVVNRPHLQDITVFGKKGVVMDDFVTLTYNGQEIKLPVIIGTEGEKAIDISGLRRDTGFITLDPGYANTGSCLSAITYMDGEKGILRYRGSP
jgi:citrate synthase